MLRRDRNDSRCTDEAGAPYRWVDFAAPNGELVFQNELEAAMEDDAKTQHEFELRMGEIMARRAIAAAGRLRGSEHLDPVRLNAQRWALWELRWTIDGRPFRQYHAEPGARPTWLLALKSHWKDVTGSPAQIDAGQEACMAEAGARYDRSRLLA